MGEAQIDNGKEPCASDKRQSGIWTNGDLRIAGALVDLLQQIAAGQVEDAQAAVWRSDQITDLLRECAIRKKEEQGDQGDSRNTPGSEQLAHDKLLSGRWGKRERLAVYENGSDVESNSVASTEPWWIEARRASFETA